MSLERPVKSNGVLFFYTYTRLIVGWSSQIMHYAGLKE